MVLVSVFLLISGILCIMASSLDWGWFFNCRNIYPYVILFGRSGARILYLLVGMGIVFLSSLVQ